MAAPLSTARLRLAPFTLEDAPFILELVNDPDWLRYIGDRNVRGLDDARRYLREGPIASYARNGFGLLRVALAESGEPIGMCGLVRRDTLPGPDLGFAFLPRHRGHGYAREAVESVLRDARERLRLGTVLAIATADNARSIALLEQAGFVPRGPAPVGPALDTTRCVLYERPP